MDKMDDTMESQYPVKHKKLHCPSYPIVPWTRWTVQWIPSASQTYKTPLSMLSYCTMDRMDGTIKFQIYVYKIPLSILSYCTMDHVPVKHIIILNPTIHPVSLYHEQDGYMCTYAIKC